MSNDISSTVLVFSKYSSHCKKLLTFINSNPHSLYTDPLIKLNLLCIDNEDVRKKIKNNEKIQVDKVPSIFVVKPFPSRVALLCVTCIIFVDISIFQKLIEFFLPGSR